jgi:hypothetical protein
VGDQLILGDQSTGALNQHYQDLQGAAAQTNTHVTVQQNRLCGYQVEGAE